jgi:acyl-CoA thioesterase FadM
MHSYRTSPFTGEVVRSTGEGKTRWRVQRQEISDIPLNLTVALEKDLGMFPWLRLVRVMSTMVGQRPIELLASTRVRMRVWPNDLDFNLHVNNGRYLMLADIGRVHWFVSSGVMRIARKQKAFPVVGDAIAKFRREMKAFEAFEIESRLVGWDHRWGFLEHRFIKNDRVIGFVGIRGVFKGPNGPVDPSVFLAELAHSNPSPPLPAWAKHFHLGSEAMSELLREEEKVRGIR